MKRIKAVMKDKTTIILIAISLITLIITIVSAFNYSKIRKLYPEKVIATPTGMQTSFYDEITVFNTVNTVADHTFYYQYEWDGDSYEISRKIGDIFLNKDIVLFINPVNPEEAIKPPDFLWYCILTLAFFLILLIFRILWISGDYLPEESLTIEEIEKEVSKLENQSMIAEKQTKKLENISSQIKV